MYKTCNRCDDVYEEYLYVVKDDFSAIVRDRKIDDVYGNVCQDCRGEIDREELYPE